jgi:hypothetical protein
MLCSAHNPVLTTSHFCVPKVDDISFESDFPMNMATEEAAARKAIHLRQLLVFLPAIHNQSVISASHHTKSDQH